MPGVTTEQARLYTDPARGELNMVFQFEHVSVDQGPAGKFDYVGLDLVVLKRSLHRWQAALAETGWNSLYWNNHDQPRVVSRFGDDHPDYWAASAKALATVLHGMRGTPFVYQGEELGMTNYPFRIPQDHKDLEAVNYYRNVLEAGGDEIAALAGLAKISRDNARTPMQWDAGPNAGFTTGDPWLPVNPNYTWLNAAAQIDATDSVFAHYQALIRLRHELPILVDGDFTPLMAEDPQIWAYTRTTPNRRLLVIANCGRDPRTVEIGREWIAADLLLGNLPETPATSMSSSLDLAGWDARIYFSVMHVNRHERDRDESGRPRSGRPRDALGRPLPQGSEGIPRIPDDLELPPAETLAFAQDLLDRGLAFNAHEVLEAAWKNGPDDEKTLWQALAQLAVGITHVQRGNGKGAVTVLRRASAGLALDGTAPYDIDVAGLADYADVLIDDLAANAAITPERLTTPSGRPTPPAALSLNPSAPNWRTHRGGRIRVLTTFPRVGLASACSFCLCSASAFLVSRYGLSSGMNHLFDVLVGGLNRRIKFSEHIFDFRRMCDGFNLVGMGFCSGNGDSMPPNRLQEAVRPGDGR